MPVVHSLAKKIVACGPTETQIKFGIKVGTDLNAIIASARGEANFEVTLSWKPYTKSGKFARSCSTDCVDWAR